MNYNPDIGLHLKLNENFCSLLVAAQKYNIMSFQFFLVKENSGKYLKIDPQDLKTFVKITKHVPNIYIHSSYWINLCSGNKVGYQTSQKILQKEIDLAKKLNIKKIVMHPGSATKFDNCQENYKCKIKGIDNLTKALNKILQKEHNIKIILENTAHGKKTVGSDLNDFKLIKQKLYYPEKVEFCIDVAHAFAYGYSVNKTNDFINILENSMGTENISLIHINDTSEQQGTKIDKHVAPGKGFIGENTLKNIINHEKLTKKPIILEIPNINAPQTIEALNLVNNWKKAFLIENKKQEIQLN